MSSFRANLQEAAGRHMGSCEQARKMCLIAKRAKEMINLSKGFLSHLLCSPSMEQLLSASPPSALGSLAAPSLFIQLHSLPQTRQRL